MIKRNTIQRNMVLDAVRKLHNHPTADEVYALVKEGYPNISRATVYRNLSLLCDAGEIRKREVPNSPDRYDHNTTNHYHVKCAVCGKFMDLDMEYLEDLNKKVTNTNGFVLTSHNIVFSGICEDCQNKK